MKQKNQPKFRDVMSHKKHKLRRHLSNVALVFVALVGLLAVTHPFIISYTAQQMTHTKPKKLVPPEKRHKPNYDAGSVTSVTVQDLLDVYNNRDQLNQNAQIVIPAIDLNMPIQPGADYYTELMGAGEQYPRDVVKPGGVGNYVLASHHLEGFWNTSALFSRINELDATDLIYINDGTTIFTYKVTVNKIIGVDNTDWIEPSVKDNQQLLTLYTCVSLRTSSTLRQIIQAKLVTSQANDKTLPAKIRDYLGTETYSLVTPQ